MTLSASKHRSRVPPRALGPLPSIWVRALPLAGCVTGVALAAILTSLFDGTTWPAGWHPLTVHHAWIGGLAGSVLGQLAATGLESRLTR